MTEQYQGHETLETLPNIEVLRNLADTRGQRIGPDIIRFLSRDSGRRKLIWVSGEPGAGKTVLASQIGFAAKQLLPNLGEPKHIKYDDVLAREQLIQGVDEVAEDEGFNNKLAEEVLSDRSFFRIVEIPATGYDFPKNRGIGAAQRIIKETDPYSVDLFMIMLAADPSVQAKAILMRETIGNTNPEDVEKILRDKFHIELVGFDNSPQAGMEIKVAVAKAAQKKHIDKMANEITQMTNQWVNEMTRLADRWFIFNPDADDKVADVVVPKDAGTHADSLIGNGIEPEYKERQVALARNRLVGRLKRKAAFLEYFTDCVIGFDKTSFRRVVGINPLEQNTLHLIRT